MDKQFSHILENFNREGHKARNLLRSPRNFYEKVTRKTNQIEAMGMGGTSLLPDVYLFRDLMMDSFSLRYKELSFLAFAHITVALDYFITVLDVCPDYEKVGLFDDMRVISRIGAEFKDEIDAYRAWRKTPSGGSNASLH